MYQKGSYNIAARVCASTREVLQRSIQHLCNHKLTYIHTLIHACIALHCIALHCIALRYITLHYISYIPTYIPTYLHHYIPTSLHPYIHTYIPTYPHTYLPKYLPTYLPTDRPTYLPTDIHTYLPTYIQETPSFPQGEGEKLPHSHRGGGNQDQNGTMAMTGGGGVRGPQFTVFFGFRGSWPNIALTWPNMGRNLYHI